MAINFPSSSTLNQISQVGSNYYIWMGNTISVYPNTI